MPARLDVDREAVKTLAVAVGVREAARRMGLNEAAVRQWSCREKWFAPTSLPPTLKKAVTHVTDPSVALSNVLANDNNETRIGFSRAARKVAARLGDESPDKLMERDTAQAANSWTSVASKVHSWEAKQQGDGLSVMVNVAILGA